MACLSDRNGDTPYDTLPAFYAAYRRLGFRLHAEGHTHFAMEAELRYSPPSEDPNYIYVNLGAWRDRIVQKIGKKRSYRRRSVGRVLIVKNSIVTNANESAYCFTLRDISSWGDKQDKW